MGPSAQSQKKKIAIVAVLAIALLVLMGLLLSLFFRGGEDGYSAGINGLDDALSVLPGETAEASSSIIKGRLAAIAEHNGVSPDDISRAEFAVRSDSVESIYENDGYVLVFVIDTDVFKQSYQAKVPYSERDDGEIQPRLTPVVTCLPEGTENLRYPDFECKHTSLETDASVEPKGNILDHLPYRSPYYFIYGAELEDGTITIKVDIDMNTHSERLRTQFNNYREESLEWMKGKDSKIEDYHIQWRNLNREVIRQTSLH